MGLPMGGLLVLS